MMERCSWQTVAMRKGDKPQEYMFFQLDDGINWVAAWDAKGKPIEGPYAKWCFDKENMKMRLMTNHDGLNSRTPSISPAVTIAD